MEVSGQLHVAVVYPQVKNSLYPLDRRLDGLQNQSRRCGAEKYVSSLPGIELRLFSQ
jgi:hypothetical protein